MFLELIIGAKDQKCIHDIWTLFTDPLFWNAVSWPLATVICVFLVRRNVSLLCEKILSKNIKFNRGLGVLEVSDVHNQRGGTPSESLQEILDGFPYLRNKVDQLKGLIEQERRNTGIEDSDAEEWYLVRCIEYFIAHNMEVVYRCIYGSQIRVLQFLNDVDVASEAEVARYYEEAKKEYSEFYEKVPFHLWIDYLKRVSLVSVGATNDQYKITEDGRQFLIYINSYGLAVEKIL